MSEPILIEAGASAHGWSRIGTFLRCPRLFWARHVDPARKEQAPSVPLARGLIAHAGFAQHFARVACEQAGRDPLIYEDPHIAMGVVARTVDESIRADALNAALTAFEAHRSNYVIEPNRIRAVELLLETNFEGYPYTARLDLVWDDRNGKKWVIDHKVVARIEDKAFTRYALSGQFLGIAWLAVRKWGDDFAGIMLNVVGMRDGKCVRRQIEPSPFALKMFPSMIVNAERRIAALTDSGDESLWQMAMHEQVCMSAYGPCDQFERCRWGCV